MKLPRLGIPFTLALGLLALLMLSVNWTAQAHAQSEPAANQRPLAPAPPLDTSTPQAGIITNSCALTDSNTFLPLISKTDLDPGPLFITTYLPLISRADTNPLPPPLPPPVLVTGTHPIDFETIRAQLQANGQDLAFVKIGFHSGPAGNTAGLSDSLTTLDAAGVPFTIKHVDEMGPLTHAQDLMRTSGLPHTLVYRSTGDAYDVPNYNLTPQQAAINHWNLHKAKFPAELDKSLTWVETINEVDKNRAEWLAEFASATAQLALADGYKWAAFGWSSGEPEPEHWEGPKMLEFLELAAQHPDRIALALHEYSYEVNEIGRWYPWLVGRFQARFDACDRNGIARPTVLITEWGWEYENVPDPADALNDMAWASWLYAAYPEVKGAAIWYLGGGYGGIANQAQQLIAPLQDYALSHYYVIEQGWGQVDPSLFPPPPPRNPRGITAGSR